MGGRRQNTISQRVEETPWWHEKFGTCAKRPFEVFDIFRSLASDGVNDHLDGRTATLVDRIRTQHAVLEEISRIEAASSKAATMIAQS